MFSTGSGVTAAQCSVFVARAGTNGIRRTEKMDRQIVIVAIVLLGFWTPATMAQLSTSDQAAIEAYRSAITSAKSAILPRGIETAFSTLTSLRETLLRVKDDRNTVLESLSEAELLNLERDLPGVMLSREEVVYVEPDVAYFERLATTNGDEADRAFFLALKATYQGTVWPVYIEQQTDYSGCTRFGSMSLVDVYRVWSEFRGKYPDRYTAQAKTEAGHVLEELTTSTCACGDVAEIVQELKRFRARFPTSPVRSKIDARLEALRTHRSNIRTYCRSG